jgi:general secretion pathway protein D
MTNERTATDGHVHVNVSRPFLPVLLASLFLFSCASSNAFRIGEKAERQQDYTRAVLQYSRAVKLDPENAIYRSSLGRARLRASEEHTLAGRRLAAQGMLKEAKDELQLALDLAPESTALAGEIRELEARKRPPTPGAQAHRPDARDTVLPGLELPPAAEAPLGITFRGASLRDSYLALGRAVGINFIFDPQFQDGPVDLDLRGVPFTDALRAFAHIGHTFHAVVGSNTVIVVPDTANKRKDYEQQVVKTIFLSNADPKAAADLLRVSLGARRVAALPDINAVTITDTPDKVVAAEHILDVIDKKRAEVVIEVELLEINRSRLRDFGIEITSGITGAAGVAGGAFPNPLTAFTLNDNPYDKKNIVISSLPGVIYRLLKNDTSTRLLANPKLRTTEGQTAQARFGEEVPVPVTTFIPLSTGSVNQQPVTSFNYRNVGVNIDLTPRVHDDGEVSIELKVEISSLADSTSVAGVQSLPTFNSRIVTTHIRLMDGETSVLAGLISDTERSGLTGIPGLSDIPILGHLFSSHHRQNDQTDIVMTLRPHVVMRPEITAEDTRSFPLASETPPLLFEVPPSSGTPAPAGRGVPEVPRIEPIRPPTPAPTANPSR